MDEPKEEPVVHNFFNDAHPNSALTLASPEVRRRANRRRREAELDAQSMEQWARGGCLSAGLIDARTDLRPDDLFEGWEA